MMNNDYVFSSRNALCYLKDSFQYRLGSAKMAADKNYEVRSIMEL